MGVAFVLENRTDATTDLAAEGKVPCASHLVPSRRAFLQALHLTPHEPRRSLQSIQVVVPIPHGILPAAVVDAGAFPGALDLRIIVTNAPAEELHELKTPFAHLVQDLPLLFRASTRPPELTLPPDPILPVTTPRIHLLLTTPGAAHALGSTAVSCFALELLVPVLDCCHVRFA